MRGRAIRISPARRLVIDFMRLSRDIPLVSVERRMRLEPVVRARSECAQRPLWMSIFTKAYGTVSRNFPELRRAYVKLPWPHFYEYAKPVAMLPLGIEYCGEEGIFTIRIGNPGAMRLSDIDSRIRNAKAAPIESVSMICRMIRFLLAIGWAGCPLVPPGYWLGLSPRSIANRSVTSRTSSCRPPRSMIFRRRPLDKPAASARSLARILASSVIRK